MEELHINGNHWRMQGVRYQLHYALHYLISSETNEIIIKWKNGDIAIINENFPYQWFIQCRCVSSDVLHFSEFFSSILKRFIKIYEESKKDISPIIYCFTLVCNKNLDDNLHELVKVLRKRGNEISSEDIRELFGDELVDRVKGYFINKKITFDYFLRTLKLDPNRTEEDLVKGTKNWLEKLGSMNSDGDLDGMLGYFLRKCPGKIEKDQMRKCLGLNYSLEFVQKGNYLSSSEKLVSEYGKRTSSDSEISIRDSEGMGEGKEMERYVEDRERSAGRIGRSWRGWIEAVDRISIQLYD